jgi:hypothetical protein
MCAKKREESSLRSEEVERWTWWLLKQKIDVRVDIPAAIRGCVNPSTDRAVLPFPGGRERHLRETNRRPSN